MVLVVILFCSNIFAFYQIWYPPEETIVRAIIKAERFCYHYFALESKDNKTDTNKCFNCKSNFEINGLSSTNYYKEAVAFEMFTNEKSDRYIAVQFYPKKNKPFKSYSTNAIPFTVYVGIGIDHVGFDIADETYITPIGITPFFLGEQGCCNLQKILKSVRCKKSNTNDTSFNKPVEIRILDSSGDEINEF